MRAVEWVAAVLGAAICLLGAIGTANSQVQMSGPGESVYRALWPMPGLVLIEWGLLGLLGLVSVALSNLLRDAAWSLGTWAVTGALFVLMLVGAFSIGPFVMVAVLCFGLSAALGLAHQRGDVKVDLLALVAGAIADLALLLFFILIGRG
jgi:hypothetical protein